MKRGSTMMKPGSTMMRRGSTMMKRGSTMLRPSNAYLGRGKVLPELSRERVLAVDAFEYVPRGRYRAQREGLLTRARFSKADRFNAERREEEPLRIAEGCSARLCGPSLRLP
jgi:hypothetical protein